MKAGLLSLFSLFSFDARAVPPRGYDIWVHREKFHLAAGRKASSSAAIRGWRCAVPLRGVTTPKGKNCTLSDRPFLC